MASSILNSTISTQDYSVTRNFFISLCFTFNIIGNIFVIVVISRSRNLRRKFIYRFTISFASTFLIDALFNLIIIIISSMTSGWPYPDFVCIMNAFTIELVDSVVLYHLLFYCIERVVAIYRHRRPAFHHNVQIIVHILVWVVGISIALPIVTGTVPSVFYYPRHSCSFGKNSPLIYSILSFILSFVLPLIVSLSLYVYILSVGVKEQTRRKQLEAQNNYARSNVAVPNVFRELHLAKFCGSFFTAWIIMCGPYKIIRFIDSIKNSADLVTLLNSNDDPILPEESETALCWMRHYYSLTPVIICLLLKPKIRRKCCLACEVRMKSIQANKTEVDTARSNISEANIVGIRGTNGITSNTGQASEDDSSGTSEDDDFYEEEEYEDPLNKSENGIVIPILFATNEGIHVQTNESGRIAPLNGDSPTFERTDDIENSLRHVVKCDVNSSHSDIVSRSSCGDGVNIPNNQTSLSKKSPSSSVRTDITEKKSTDTLSGQKILIDINRNEHHSSTDGDTFDRKRKGKRSNMKKSSTNIDPANAFWSNSIQRLTSVSSKETAPSESIDKPDAIELNSLSPTVTMEENQLKNERRRRSRSNRRKARRKLRSQSSENFPQTTDEKSTEMKSLGTPHASVNDIMDSSVTLPVNNNQHNNSNPRRKKRKTRISVMDTTDSLNPKINEGFVSD